MGTLFEMIYVDDAPGVLGHRTGGDRRMPASPDAMDEIKTRIRGERTTRLNRYHRKKLSFLASLEMTKESGDDRA